jgi:predicted RNA-binding protein Jag
VSGRVHKIQGYEDRLDRNECKFEIFNWKKNKCVGRNGRWLDADQQLRKLPAGAELVQPV